MWHTLIDPRKLVLPKPGEALAGRAERMPVASRHFVAGTPLEPPFPDGVERAGVRDGLLLGRGAQAVGGARRLHDGGGLRRRDDAEPDLPGGLQRADGAHGGRAVVFDPGRVGYEQLLRCSGRATIRPRACARATTWGPSTARPSTARPMRSAWRRRLRGTRTGACSRRPASSSITTEILPAGEFYYAEDYHQQYLARNPGGYCGLGGTGVACPVGLGAGS